MLLIMLTHWFPIISSKLKCRSIKKGTLKNIALNVSQQVILGSRSYRKSYTVMAYIVIKITTGRPSKVDILPCWTCFACP